MAWSHHSLQDYFKSKRLEYQLEPFSTVGGSDYFPFLALGVPAGSIATGAGSIKNSAMRDKYVFFPFELHCVKLSTSMYFM